MDRKKSYEYIHVGLIVRYCSSLDVKSKKEEIIDGLETLKKSLDDIGFAVSINLVNFLLDDIIQNLSELKPDHKIPANLWSKYKTEVESIESTIYAEAGTKFVHVVPNRRYNTEYLLEQPHRLLKDGLFIKLPDIAKYDFASACRCISYGEATAGAFHVLRATEALLKQFYYKHKKTKRLAKPMWGPMTSELKAKKTNKVNDTILSMLDLVRVSYRNPTQHPEAVYDIESAQDLLGVCIDLINKMAREL